MSGPAAAQAWRAAPKRGGGNAEDDDSYFDDEPESRGQRGRCGAGVSNRQKPAQPIGAVAEADPLDAFMAEINAEIARTTPSSKVTESKKTKAPWEELQSEDPVASYFEVYEKGAKRKAAVGSDAEDEDDEVFEEDGDRRKKAIEPMAPVDHSKITYNVVKTDFYVEHEEVARLNGEEVANLRKQYNISATGSRVPSPVASFGHLAASLGKELMEGIRRHGYSQPTPIQAQAIPAALKGRDVIGIAETGSGKTVAYLLPMLVHAAAQTVLKKDEGPIGLVLCPTRELAVQIETEVFKFNKQLGLRSVTLAGGLSKLEQFKEIRRGCQFAICNPGRLIDIVKMKGCNLSRVTVVVLDEADRMFHMGFEYQVRSIMQNVRPSRQTMLFSATFPPKIEHLSRDILHQPVRVTIGEVGQAASAVEQKIEVVKNDDAKWPWLSQRIDALLAKGQVLIFVKAIASAEELTQNFKDFLGKKTETLHGDLDQGERMRIISSYRKRKTDVLIATDVAARGLDITSIRTVVSFDVARDIETHTHRVGRTGRAGTPGEAFTLLTQDDDKKMAALLVESLESSNQAPSEDAKNLALKYGPYRAAKLAGKKFEGKKKMKGGGVAVQSTFGVGFDGQAMKQETAQDLERRLNKEADQLAKQNRSIMAKAGQGRMNFAAAHRTPGGPAGFVAAATSDEPSPLPKGPSVQHSDSDDDLLAPGVNVACSKPPKAAGASPRTPAALQAATAAAAAAVPPTLAQRPPPIGGHTQPEAADAQMQAQMQIQAQMQAHMQLQMQMQLHAQQQFHMMGQQNGTGGDAASGKQGGGRGGRSRSRSRSRGGNRRRRGGWD
eukprot:TRINITY_DN12064_c0_g1_i1.p1 TRINITY_DN12064_c0_g1~~TRINITY_DN12064_c0_g1_i1.p1  ORF type:complete len:835 (+),score=216.82 TRINITY_DN12064_c0_g1_i1:224-2728(+)